MSNFRIRKALRSDADKVFSLVSCTIDTCYTGQYTDKIVGAFHDFHSFKNILSDIDRSKCYIAVFSGEVVGTVTADAPEVHRLFVLPDMQGEGVGAALLRFAEREIQKTSSFVQVVSSILAETFYEHMGYSLKEDCTDEVCGEPIYWKVYVKNFALQGVAASVAEGKAIVGEERNDNKSEKNSSGFFELVYAAVQEIPYGKVASYGQIARLCGNPRSSRAVGYALHANPLPGIVPCHRVVNREGRLAPAFAFGGAEVQKDLLEREGVEVVQRDGLYYVEMEKYRWIP